MAREVYPSPPLRLVVAELRYPFAPRLGAPEVLSELTTRFRHAFPVPDPTAAQIIMAVGGAQPTAATASANRFFSKDRTASVTVTPTNLVVETSSYGEYDRFRPTLQAGLETLATVHDGIVGIERVGLRYINEIRVSGLSDPRDWDAYVDASLVAPLRVVPGAQISLMQSVLQTEPRDGVVTLLRSGALRGQAVSSMGPLKVAEVPADDPFFLLDIDNSWASADAFEEYTVERTLALYDRLHAPIDELFEASITERSRDLFRRREG